MCRNYNKRFFLSLLFLTIGLSSFAQNSNKENSPYTRYGIGEYRNGVNTLLRGMAGISSAYTNQYAVNTDNPASYATLKFTTYEAGIEGSMRTVHADNKSFATGMATLSYLTVGIPLGKYAGMALGLRPYTRVYYHTRDSIVAPGIGPALREYTGDGSINYAFVGASGKFKNFSAGFNFGYLFGTIRNSSILRKQYDTVNAYNSDFSKFTKIGGLYYKLGLMYDAKLNKNLSLRIGGTLSLNQDISAKKDEYALSTISLPGEIPTVDTAVNIQNLKGDIILPMSYSFGVHLYNTEKWAVGVDFAAAQWSQYRNFEAIDSVADNTYRIAIGGEYTPNPTSLYKYLNRVTYRLGFYYGKDYIQLHNTSINYSAITIGASLPFKRSLDRIHIGMEIGKRGTETNGLIRENFFKFNIGMSLNDKWFVKRKYD